MNTLTKNIFSLVTLRFADYLLPFVTVPYLVRVLGPENYGRIAFAQAFIQYFVMITDYGFNLSATSAIARSGGDSAAISSIFNAVMGVKFVAMAIGFLVMCGIAQVVPSMRKEFMLFLVCYLAVVGNALFPVWLYQGLQRMGYITVLSIIARSLVVLAIFLIVRKSGQYIVAAGLLALGTPLAGAAAFFYAVRIANIQIGLPSFASMKHALVDGWHVFTATFGLTLYNNSNVFVLAFVAPPAVVGYFAAADKLVRAFLSLVAPVAQAAFPHIAVLIESSHEEAFRFVGKLLRLFVLCTVTLMLLLYFGADLIANLAFGAQYAASADIIRVLSPWPLIFALNVVFGALFIIQLNLGRLLSISVLAPALIHILCIFPVARFAGAEGTAVLIILTELSVFLIRVFGTCQTQRQELGFISLGMLGFHA